MSTEGFSSVAEEANMSTEYFNFISKGGKLEHRRLRPFRKLIIRSIIFVGWFKPKRRKLI